MSNPLNLSSPAIQTAGRLNAADVMRAQGRSDCEAALKEFDDRIGPSQFGSANACLSFLGLTEKRMRAGGAAVGEIAAYTGGYREALRRRASESGPQIKMTRLPAIL